MKTPKARKISSNSWRTEVMVGGRRYSFVSEDKDESERLAMLKKLQQSGRESDYTALLSTITVREAIDAYLSDTDNVLSQSTVRSYRSMQEYRFQSVMDKRITSRINWQSVINQESRSYVKKKVRYLNDNQYEYKIIETDKQLSPKTILNAWGMIHAVLEYHKLPIPDVRLPMQVKKEHLFLDPEEIKTFLRAIEGHRYELPYLLCLHGLRRSEMASVRKPDIVKIRGKFFIRVSGSMVFDENNKLIEKETNKTKDSTRLVPVMIPRLLELVKEAEDGKLFKANINAICHPLNTICRNNDLPECGLHGLRHSFASLGYHLDIKPMVVQKWGGWSSGDIVQRIYTHLANMDEEEAMDKMGYFYAE